MQQGGVIVIMEHWCLVGGGKDGIQIDPACCRRYIARKIAVQGWNVNLVSKQLIDWTGSGALEQWNWVGEGRLGTGSTAAKDGGAASSYNTLEERENALGCLDKAVEFDTLDFPQLFHLW